MYASNYFENAMLNLMRSQNITAPSNLYVGLFLSSPGDDGSSGTEISYTGYARQRITFSAPVADGSGMRISNNNQITFPESLVSAGSVTYIGIFDAVSGGNMWLYAQLDTALNVQSGVSPVFRSGTISWIWSGNISTYYKTAIMNTLRGTNCSGFSPYIALCNGDPTGSGSEFSGNNYARFAVTMTAPEQQTTGVAMSSNSAEASSSVSTGAWGTLSHIAICNAATGGNPFAVGALGTSYAIHNGYSVTIPANALQVNVN